MKLNHEQYWQSVVGTDRNKKKKEVEKRDSEAKKWQAQTSAFPQQRELLRKAKERDTVEWNKIDTKWKQLNKSVPASAEAFINALLNAIPHQGASTESVAPAFPGHASDISALQKDFATFKYEVKNDLTATQNKVQKLELDCKISDDKNRRLESERAELWEKSVSLESELRLTSDKVRELEALAQKQADEIKAFKEDMADAKKRHKKSGSETMKLKEDLDSLDKRLDKRVADVRREFNSSTLQDDFNRLDQTCKTSTQNNVTIRKELDSHRTTMMELERRTASSADVLKITSKTEQLSTELQESKQSHSELERRFEQRQNEVSATIGDLKTQCSHNAQEWSALRATTGELDFGLIQHVLDRWISHDVDQLLEGQDGLRSKSSKGEDPHSTIPRSAPHPAIDASQEVIEQLKSSVQKTQQDISSLSDSLSGVELKIKVAVQETIEEANDAIGEMMDSLATRVGEIVVRVDTLEAKGVQARTPTPTPRLDVRVSPAANDLDLAARLQTLEDQKLAEGLLHLTKKLAASDALIAENRRVAAVELDKIGNLLQGHTIAREELRGEFRVHLEQQELQLQNLNSGLNNMNTQNMAQTILRGLDSYTSRIGPRLDMANNRINNIEQQLRILLAMGGAAGSMSQPQTNKRVVSPRSLADDAAKRRRTNINGGHAAAASSTSFSSPTVQPAPGPSGPYQ